MFKICGYVPDDYPTVERILKEAGVFSDPRDTKRNYDALVAAEPDSVLVAVKKTGKHPEPRVVGSIMTTPMGITNAAVWAWAVDVDYLNRGIGSLLMNTMTDNLRARGFEEVWAFVDVQNEISRLALEGCAFEFNTHHTYYGPWKSLVEETP